MFEGHDLPSNELVLRLQPRESIYLKTNIKEPGLLSKPSQVELDGAPAGEKGLHIHETADCSDIPNKSMGGHFSPKNHDHGLPSATEHHVGDLGNIRIGEDGKGKLTFTVVGANLKEGDPMGLIGKSVVLHESNDKGTGKAGDAGSPVACAPIKSS